MLSKVKLWVYCYTVIWGWGWVGVDMLYGSIWATVDIKVSIVILQMLVLMYVNGL